MKVAAYLNWGGLWDPEIILSFNTSGRYFPHHTWNEIRLVSFVFNAYKYTSNIYLEPKNISEPSKCLEQKFKRVKFIFFF